MKNRMLKWIGLLIAALMMIGCKPSVPSIAPPIQSEPSNDDTTASTDDAEMRGVWVSRFELESLLAGKTVDQARTAVDTIMENCKAYGIDTVFFQVRGNSDAYYASSIFQTVPTAQKLLDGGLDILEYAVQKAHDNGLELHAWVNPYRIGTDLSYRVENITGDDWFIAGERGYYTPSSPTVRMMIVNGIREILENYDVDGIHFDDYFYPNGVFSDTVLNDCEKADYEEYRQDGGTLDIPAWRRWQNDQLVSAVYALCHTYGKVFGVSPSGSYRKPFEKLYADTRKWLSESGYVDYLCPQIYFGFDHATVPFDQLTQEWLEIKKAKGVKLYIGLALSKVGLDPDIYAGESGAHEWAQGNGVLKRSVEYLRAYDGIDGFAFFSYTYFQSDSPRSLSQYTDDGKTYKQTYNAEAAAREVDLLLPLLK